MTGTGGPYISEQNAGGARIVMGGNDTAYLIQSLTQAAEAMDKAIKETERRRKIQTDYNTKHGITPQTIIKKIHDITDQLRSDHDKAVVELVKIDEAAYTKNPKKVIAEKERQMNSAVKILDFETAAILRDEIDSLRGRAERALKAEVKSKNKADKELKEAHRIKSAKSAKSAKK